MLASHCASCNRPEPVIGPMREANRDGRYDVSSLFADAQLSDYKSAMVLPTSAPFSQRPGVYGQTEAMGGGFPVETGDPVAYSEGDVGWIADRPRLTGPDGSALPFRLTVVTVRTGGDWKIAQMHFSIGVPNEQAFGEELPT